MDVLYVLGWVAGILAYLYLMLVSFEAKMVRLLYVPPEGVEIDYQVEKPRRQRPPQAALPSAPKRP